MTSAMVDAACRGVDPDLFFPITHQGPGAIQTEQAKAICRSCPLLADCLTEVLHNPPEFGIWAATDPNERRALRASLQLA